MTYNQLVRPLITVAFASAGAIGGKIIAEKLLRDGLKMEPNQQVLLVIVLVTIGLLVGLVNTLRFSSREII